MAAIPQATTTASPPGQAWREGSARRCPPSTPAPNTAPARELVASSDPGNEDAKRRRGCGGRSEAAPAAADEAVDRDACRRDRARSRPLGECPRPVPAAAANGNLRNRTAVGECVDGRVGWLGRGARRRRARGRGVASDREDRAAAVDHGGLFAELGGLDEGAAIRCARAASRVRSKPTLEPVPGKLRLSERITVLFLSIMEFSRVAHCVCTWALIGRQSCFF